MQDTGLVVKHIESWDVEPARVVRQLLKPSASVPATQVSNSRRCVEPRSRVLVPPLSVLHVLTATLRPSNEPLPPSSSLQPLLGVRWLQCIRCQRCGKGCGCPGRRCAEVARPSCSRSGRC